MKRLHEILKPFLAIILGALMLLYYMNALQAGGTFLAIGIVAMVLAAFYLGVGVVGLVVGNKLPASGRKVFELGSVIAFPTFMFVYFLLDFISTAQDWGVENIGPTGWVLLILKLAASLCFVAIFAVAFFVKNKALDRLAVLFAATFVLALLSEILFSVVGNAVGLGGIIVVEFAIYFVYCNILFASLPLGKPEAAKEEPEAEPEEEAPAEEEQEA